MRKRGMGRIMITGASRGIGAETSRLMAAQGYDLVLLCKSSLGLLQELKQELEESYGVSCMVMLCDVADPAQVTQAVLQAGRIDVLIHNAGISYVGLLQDMSLEEWHRVIDTNLNSAFYLSKAVLPQMVERKAGKLIFVSSVWGNVGASTEVAYSASKGGVNSFTRALAKELAPSHIQVNAAAFGAIDTDMNRCFSEEELESLTEEIPTDRLGSPKEAAEMILQILNAPDYLTGQVITMDGGWI